MNKSLVLIPFEFSMYKERTLPSTIHRRSHDFLPAQILSQQPCSAGNEKLTIVFSNRKLLTKIRNICYSFKLMNLFTIVAVNAIAVQSVRRVDPIVAY